jgi:hypothetical protein
MEQQPLVGQGHLIIEASRHSETPIGNTPLDNDQPETSTWQHSQETGVHTSGGIRTHSPKKRAAADTNLLHKENMTYFVNYCDKIHTAYW